MTLDVHLFIDHTCPYSYMTYSAARQVTLGRPYRIHWHPLPIAGADTRFTAAERVMHATRHEAEWPAIQALAAAGYGLQLSRPEWGVDARPPAAAARWVTDVSVPTAAAMHARLFRAYFEEGQDIGDADVVGRLVAELGLDAGALHVALGSGELDRRLDEAILAAEAQGITAVPAMLVGGYLSLGAQSIPVLERTLEQVALATGRDPDAIVGEGTCVS